jgi:hypothetical protein
MTDYPLIVVPECDYLEPDFKRALLAYVNGGGNLLLVGSQTAALFPTELGVNLKDELLSQPRFLAHQGTLAPTKGAARTVVLLPRAQPVGRLHATNDVGSPAHAAASIAQLGRGHIAATYFSFSQGYLSDRSETMRGFLNDLVRQLFPKPLVEVKGSPDVDVAVNRISSRLAVNLVNTAGPHADTQDPIQDAIPAVGPLDITIRQATKPTKVTLEPGGKPLAFEFRDGETRLTLTRLDIHSVVLVE